MEVSTKKLSEIQMEFGIADKQLSKLIKVSVKKIGKLKKQESLSLNTLIYFTKQMKIPAEAWGLGKIKTAMIERGISWKMLAIKVGISIPILREIAEKVENSDFRVNRAFLYRICSELRLKKGNDFRDLYPDGAYNKEFKDETSEEKTKRLKATHIIGKKGSLRAMTPERKTEMFKKAEEECSPEAKDPEFNIQDFIRRQADRLKTGK